LKKISANQQKISLMSMAAGLLYAVMGRKAQAAPR